MIGAAISARRRGRRSTSILRSHNAHVSRQCRVDIVGVDGYAAGRGVASHVLVDHGEHGPALRPVLGEDGLGSQETTFLATVEVELESVLGTVAGLGEDAEGFEDDNGA